MMTPKQLGPGEGEITQFLMQSQTFKVTPAENGGRYLQFEAFTTPGTGAPPHLHYEADEAFYVLAGQYEFLLGEAHFLAATGAFVFVPRGTVHAFTNTGQDVARLLITVTPGVQHEEFFRAASELIERGDKLPELSQLATFASKYDWIMVQAK